jgi:hypothetical protein
VSDKFVVYHYDANKHKVVSAPAQIDSYYRTSSGDLRVVKNIVDDKVWFDKEQDCEVYHRQKMVNGEIL